MRRIARERRDSLQCASSSCSSKHRRSRVCSLPRHVTSARHNARLVPTTPTPFPSRRHSPHPPTVSRHVLRHLCIARSLPSLPARPSHAFLAQLRRRSFILTSLAILPPSLSITLQIFSPSLAFSSRGRTTHRIAPPAVGSSSRSLARAALAKRRKNERRISGSALGRGVRSGGLRRKAARPRRADELERKQAESAREAR